MFSGVFVPDLDLTEALHTVAVTGAAFVPEALAEAFREGLQREIEGGPLEPAPYQIGQVRQETEVLTISAPMDGYPTVAALCRALTDLVRRQGRGIAGLDRYAPNVCHVQRYRPGALGITPHLDGKRFALLVAVFTTKGSARFTIHAERFGPPIEAWEVTPGSLVLLRGPGLAGIPDGRPFHAVGGPVAEPRYSVSFRMDTRAQPAPLNAPGTDLR
jgi:alkylated DNA repair dioxygenase AlkB